MALLQVRDLSIRYATPEGEVVAVDGLGFDIAPGEALGLVGESGSGKSQSALALMGLLGGSARIGGSVRFGETELLTLKSAQMNRIRGDRIAMIFQDPMTSLNPHLRIGVQMAEVLEQHRGMSRTQAREESRRMLEAVRIADAAHRLDRYPHEFSGGMRQRVMIAMALLCRPQLLIADEPTTALDVTVQAQILALLDELRRDIGIAVLLITHDLGLVAELCERTLVMYAGRAMEYGLTADVLKHPQHPYTQALLDSRPRLDSPQGERLTVIPGQPRGAAQRDQGCVFRTRCTQAYERCERESPLPRALHGSAVFACHRNPLPNPQIRP